MVDYALAAKITPFQAPNVLALAQQGQQMQTNMLAAQKFQQDLQLRSGLMREIEGGLDLTSPEAVNRLARYSPELALTLAKGQADIAQSRAAAESSRASAAAARATAAFTGKKIEEADLALVGKHGDAAREGFARILNLAQDDPELASQAYDAMLSDIRKKSPALASQFSPKFSVDAARRGLLTVEQLQAQALPQKPEIIDLGNGVKGIRDPRNPNVVRELGVVPFGAEGIPAPRAEAPVSGPMGGAPLAAAPAAPVGAFGSLAGAAPALQGTATIPASELAARKKLSESGARVEEERQKTVARETAKESVASDARKRGAAEVLAALPEKDIEKLIMRSTSGGFEITGASIPGYFGVSTSGMEAIRQLETLGGDLTLRLLGGKLGAGISNRDVELVQATLGQIANPKVPAEERLAAFRQLMNNLRSTSGGGKIEIAPGSAKTKAPAAGAIEDGYRFKGGDPRNPSNWEKL